MRDKDRGFIEEKKSSSSFTLDRREFLKLVGGGIVVTFTLGETATLESLQRFGSRYPEDFNAYLRIGEDGRVSCLTGKIEMGQGIITSLAQMLADEMDVPLDRVDMVMGDTALCPWDMGTFGSRSTKYFGARMRKAAAEAKAVLILLASEHLQVPKKRLETREGMVLDKKNPQNKVSYAQLTKGKTIERHLEEKPDIEPYPEHNICGKPADRRDNREKVTGEAKYAGDIRLPGMLYARILRPPMHGATLKSVDFSKAREIKGIRIVKKKDLMAVLHSHRDQAEKALEMVDAEYDLPSQKVNNRNIFDHLQKVAPQGEEVARSGNLQTGKKKASQKFKKTYFNHYVSHAPMENHTAAAKVEGDKVTVWASTQSPFGARDDVAEALGWSKENVRVKTPFVGGGFGGKTRSQQAVEAARLSRITGKPVQVTWSRKEEFFYDTFRPAAVVKVHSGLNPQNRVEFWDYEIFYAGSRSSEPFYDIPHYRVTSRGGWFGDDGAHPFMVGAWRGPGSNTNVFAIESQIDDMASQAGMDPLEFRLRNLQDQRMIRVLKAAAKKFGRSFSKAPSGKGYGIACTDYLNTYLATMAEVEVDKNSGEIQVQRVVCAQDTGEVINPEGVRLQIEGCITMGLGYVLAEEVRFQGGEILDENFGTYHLPRFSWVPEIETVLVRNPGLSPQGCGEPAITPMGGVIANAVFDATGARMVTLPMTPERVKAAL
ncbi:xanthine dehydrogenase family protein molybdopterin-binding subunit [bacterium]|nr:xanthine dehydrogenase family protein molybdopterin-binding subunit [bacterium]